MNGTNILNTLDHRQALPEEVLAGRRCCECLRSRQHGVGTLDLFCMLEALHTRPNHVCDGFLGRGAST